MKVCLFFFGDGHDYYAMFCSISWVHQYGPLLQTISTQKDLHYLALTTWSDSSVETKGVLSHLVHDIWPVASEQQHFWCVFKGLKLIVAEVCSNLWGLCCFSFGVPAKCWLLMAVMGISPILSVGMCCSGSALFQARKCEEGVTNKIVARCCRAVFKGSWLVWKPYSNGRLVPQDILSSPVQLHRNKI